MKLTKTARKWILIPHILFSAIMVGNMATFVILNITVLTTSDPFLITSCYKIMNILSDTSIKASTIGATVTGIILSVGTHYGLFKYWWIIVKEILTVLLIGINLWGMYSWTLEALENIVEGGLETQSTLANLDLWTGIVLQSITLVFLFVISKFKPWGYQKKYNKGSR
ncbi:hypothetical protein [Fredinandcohnia sp. FSL W7-1320]|uniref:hypothetical protein n=1 Tax=Fredinandcohnia sp. FSL W7-1320 TaxID=2954540 RepID=UPI0030FD4A23